ncbi:MAG TPA: hypothetical protein EYP24_03400, partial [bacterium (Candidatus Stahlbacteria)]|nr:hypothetical protein [Candidatus Stahlbacteria bacterium]
MRLSLSIPKRRLLLITLDLLTLVLISKGYLFLLLPIWLLLIDAVGGYEIRFSRDIKAGLTSVFGAGLFLCFFYLIIYMASSSLQTLLIRHLLLGILSLSLVRIFYRMVFYQALFRFRIAILSDEDEVKRFFSQSPEFEICDNSLLHNGGGLPKNLIDAVVIRNGFVPHDIEHEGIPVLKFECIYEELTGRVYLDAVDGLAKDSGFYDWIKRVLDIIGATVGLIIYGIILPVLTFLIKLDSPGPIFYRQKRTGKDNRSYTIYKLRTM